MTREEVARLPSRALAAIQFFSALEEITYLPQRMMSVQHYGRTDARLGMTFFGLVARVEISSLLFRIAGLLTLAWLFWNCGPRVSQLLLPEGAKEPSANLGDGGDETRA